MSTAGPNYPSTGADDSAVGSITWSSPGNITAEDNVYATSLGKSDNTTHYLKGTEFGFSVPAGSTIDGITVTISRKASGASAGIRAVYDSIVRLVIGGSVVGDNKAATSTMWPLAEATASYGGISDKWGLTPTADDVNGSDFGVVLSARHNGSLSGQSSVDSITVIVTYTEGGGPSFQSAWARNSNAVIKVM